MSKVEHELGDGMEGGSYWAHGKRIYMEVCKNEQLPSCVGLVEGYHFLLATGYIGGIYHKKSEEHTYRNTQDHSFITNDIGKLVDMYIEHSSLGKDRGILPIRNMRSDEDSGSAPLSSFVPLSEDEMNIFKGVLETRDIKRYKLSFPNDK